MEMVPDSLMDRQHFLLVVIIYPVAGKVRTVKSLLRTLIKEVETKEVGCIRYNVTEEYGNDNKARFVTIEQYTDEAAYATHAKSPWVAEFIGKAVSGKMMERLPESIQVAPLDGFAR